jgi:DNA-binding transcriptional regulator GbsR (MarR family)
VNRSVAQIHALLWLTGRPMPSDEIAEVLGIARSNASTSLEDLQSYRLVSLVHMIGDRRNFYEAKGDPWDVVETIVEERKKREIDPTLEVLRAARDLADNDPTTPPDVRRRVGEMLAFVERVMGWYDQMKRVPRPTLQRLIKLGSGVARLVATK